MYIKTETTYCGIDEDSMNYKIIERELKSLTASSNIEIKTRKFEKLFVQKKDIFEFVEKGFWIKYNYLEFFIPYGKLTRLTITKDITEY